MLVAAVAARPGAGAHRHAHAHTAPAAHAALAQGTWTADQTGSRAYARAQSTRAGTDTATQPWPAPRTPSHATRHAPPDPAPAAPDTASTDTAGSQPGARAGTARHARQVRTGAAGATADIAWTAPGTTAGEAPGTVRPPGDPRSVRPAGSVRAAGAAGKVSRAAGTARQIPRAAGEITGTARTRTGTATARHLRRAGRPAVSRGIGKFRVSNVRRREVLADRRREVVVGLHGAFVDVVHHVLGTDVVADHSGDGGRGGGRIGSEDPGPPGHHVLDPAVHRASAAVRVLPPVLRLGVRVHRLAGLPRDLLDLLHL